MLQHYIIQELASVSISCLIHSMRLELLQVSTHSTVISTCMYFTLCFCPFQKVGGTNCSIICTCYCSYMGDWLTQVQLALLFVFTQLLLFGGAAQFPPLLSNKATVWTVVLHVQSAGCSSLHYTLICVPAGDTNRSPSAYREACTLEECTVLSHASCLCLLPCKEIVELHLHGNSTCRRFQGCLVFYVELTHIKWLIGIALQTNSHSPRQTMSHCWPFNSCGPTFTGKLTLQYCVPFSSKRTC